ncbi:flavodoxin family protein [Microbacterium rhizomatis]|uniref:Flavodoxin family protein n=1 Tax=Microbacterium rhizomatis TaxID=1631477 RepID=A0A5J5J0N5_9MICO|nr:flavodoxin domain-containing protein [Microbacterium rhizomatis]KAA9108096.1 flavodoxin family protein [Microbacterium rhizomatis]
MEVLVIYETMFGNTAQVARAIADGLSEHAHVIVTDVADAPADIPPQVDAVVVGGPTHAFSMSRASSRESAVQRGAVTADLRRGIRDWLDALPRGEHPQAFVAFDTRVDVPLLPGAASRSATRVARRLGFTASKPESFLVEGYEGPVVSGELDRARLWGERLADELAVTSR